MKLEEKKMPKGKTRPKIEDVIYDVLSGDEQKNALDFVAFLRKNKMSPQWGSTNSWAVSHKNKRVCFIRLAGTAHYHNLESGSWHINHVNYGRINLTDCAEEYDHYISNENLEDLVWNSVRYCAKCSNCKPGNVVMILGKQFDEMCHSWFVMKNPDGDALNFAKKIVIMSKQAIANKIS